MLSDIKLVIWDLDETFWDGTLSEGVVTPIPRYMDRIKTLCARGVMNSICSKNDPDVAQAELERLGVWDYFVFPSIMWAAKGEQVRQIIERMKLRAANVLFVDDNALNREEVRHHNEDIQVLDPSDWVDVDVSGWGKDDSGHSRLAQYKLLEAKTDAAVIHGGHNEDFLRKSNIQCRVETFDITRHDADRVVEVLNRTNQLNFTKRRFPSGLAMLLHDMRRAEAVGYVVYVTDDYGDYGLCGFMSVAGSGEVQDFAFSCRLLDMGVERALLGFLRDTHPGLTAPFQADIAGSDPDWVTITHDDTASAPPPQERTEPQRKVFMAAACFSEIIAPFMEPEFTVVGLPDMAPLPAELLHKSRTASVIYWSGRAPELRNLFDGEFEILNLSVAVHITFPAVWVPVLGRIPIPMPYNTRILKRHPEAWQYVTKTIEERGEYLGRRLEDEGARKQLTSCLRLSSNPLIARQAEFCPKRFRKRLYALRARLPERTKIVLRLSRDDPDFEQYSGPLAALNPEILRHTTVANQVALDFVQNSSNTDFLEAPKGSASSNDMAAHLSHEQAIAFAQNFKRNLLEVMARS